MGWGPTGRPLPGETGVAPVELRGARASRGVRSPPAAGPHRWSRHRLLRREHDRRGAAAERFEAAAGRSLTLEYAKTAVGAQAVEELIWHAEHSRSTPDRRLVAPREARYAASGFTGEARIRASGREAGVDLGDEAAVRLGREAAAQGDPLLSAEGSVSRASHREVEPGRDRAAGLGEFGRGHRRALEHAVFVDRAKRRPSRAA